MCTNRHLAPVAPPPCMLFSAQSPPLYSALIPQARLDALRRCGRTVRQVWLPIPSSAILLITSVITMSAFKRLCLASDASKIGRQQETVELLDVRRSRVAGTPRLSATAFD